MIIGEQQVAGVADVERDGVGAVIDLLLGLGRQELPIMDVIEHEFVAGMMFDRHFIDMAGRVGVGDVEARLGEAVGAPDVGEGAAAAIRHPDAGILGIEPAVGDRIAGVDAQRAEHLAVGGGRAAAAHDLDVLDQALLARPPEQGRGARVHPAGEEAEAREDIVAALAAFEDRQDGAEAGMIGVVIGNEELRDGRVQADEDAVRAQGQPVRHLVEAGREIEDAIGVDRLLQGGGVVRLAVADRAQGADIDPLLHRRQVADRGRARRRHGGERLDVGGGGIVARVAECGHGEAIGEIGDPIGLALAVDRPAAVAEAGEDRAVDRQRIIEADLGEDILLVRDDDAGLRHIFEPDILAPEAVAVAAVDLDPDRRVPDRDIDEGEVDLMLADRRVALAVECRIEQGKLPGGRGLFGDDAVSAALKMDILDHVAGLIDAGKGGAETEFHMAQESMLGHAEAHAGGGRIARADLDIDIAHRRIEGARIGIPNDLVAGHDGRHRDRHLADLILIAAREDHHGRHALLEARRVGAEQQ